jgi:hypothetical protein
LKDICADAGVILAFRPPYSPDFNPIERAFGQLKKWIKKNWKLCESMPVPEFLRLGLTALKDQAAGHFYSCGIGRDPEDSDSEWEEDEWEDEWEDDNAVEEGNVSD